MRYEVPVAVNILAALPWGSSRNITKFRSTYFRDRILVEAAGVSARRHIPENSTRQVTVTD